MVIIFTEQILFDLFYDSDKKYVIYDIFIKYTRKYLENSNSNVVFTSIIDYSKTEQEIILSDGLNYGRAGQNISTIFDVEETGEVIEVTTWHRRQHYEAKVTLE